MADINISFIISLMIIGLGYISKKTKIVKESDGEGIARIIFNFTLPALVLTAFSNVKIDVSLLLLPVINILFALFMTFIGMFLFKNMNIRDKGMSIMLIAGFNIGLFAYPIIEMIWGNEGLKYFGMFDVGNAFIVFGTNYIIANIYSNSMGEKIDYKKILKKVFTSIPFLTYILALFMAVFQLSLPGILKNMVLIISKANMPLSLILLGIYLTFNLNKENIKKMLKILMIRYGFGIVFGVLMFLIFPFGELFRITLLLGLIMPISLAVIPYSVEFNYDKSFVGTINTFTIIISFLLIWLGTFYITS
ncbi:MAG: AEC family transporter [Clostridiales bacterium]